MSFTTRAKNIILSPAAEWQVISGEVETPRSLLVKYVIPMALIPAIACFIGYGLIGVDAVVIRIGGLYWGLVMAMNSFITSWIVYYSSTYIVNALAPAFHSVKDPGRSAQLVAYSYTPAWLAGIFYCFPVIGKLAILGLFGVYLFYLGVPVMKRTPEDQRIAYTIVSAIVVIVIRFLTALIISNIIYFLTGNPFLPYGTLNNMQWG